MVWIDMEMTGLDPDRDKIIEMATIITDSQLNILAEGPSLILHQPPRVLEGMDEWNQKHHQKSGLLDEVKNSQISVKKAQTITLDFIKHYCLPRKSPLCGNAIHHDRRFIIKYMPELNDYLHYRHVDVTSFKILIQNWYPQNKDLPEKKDVHRALSDIRESIEELMFYRKTYFK